MWQLQTDQPQAGRGQHLGDRLVGRARSQRETELLVLDAGRDGLVGVRVDAGRDPDQHRLRKRDQRGELLDLVERVDHDPPDPIGQCGLEVLGGFHVAVQHDPVGRETDRPRHREFTRRAHVERQALLGEPAQHRPARQRLARERDLRLRQRMSVGARPGPDLVLVEQRARGAEARGEVSQRNAGETQVAAVDRVRCGGPDPRRQPGLDRASDAGQQLRECHAVLLDRLSWDFSRKRPFPRRRTVVDAAMTPGRVMLPRS